MIDFATLNFATAGELIDSNMVLKPDYVLKGLLRGHIGMLIAAPDTGKSHLALSIAIEHSSNSILLNLSQTKTPSKTLLISAEDGHDVVKERLIEKLVSLPRKCEKIVRSNLFTFSSSLPLILPPEAPMKDKATTSEYIKKIIELIKSKGIDLVIIDTVSEVIGECDEVKHDRLIKLVFQRIARESGAAILLVHHVNKMEIRGEQEITMASGAGLTSIMRLSKFIATIKVDKTGKKTLNLLKANYLHPSEIKEFEIKFVDNLLVNPSVMNFSDLPIKGAIQDDSKIKENLKVKPETIYIKARPESAEKKETRKRLRNAF